MLHVLFRHGKLDIGGPPRIVPPQVALPFSPELAVRCVPELHARHGSNRGHPGAVGPDGERRDGAAVGELPDHVPRIHVPQADHAVAAPAEQMARHRGHVGHHGGGLGHTGEFLQGLRRCSILGGGEGQGPDTNHRIRLRGRHAAAAIDQRDRTDLAGACEPTDGSPIGNPRRQHQSIVPTGVECCSIGREGHAADGRRMRGDDSDGRSVRGVAQDDAPVGKTDRRGGAGHSGGQGRGICRTGQFGSAGRRPAPPEFDGAKGS